MKYLKLGEKATMFYDPASRVLIRGTEVVAVKAVQKTKKLAQALSQGHISWATEEDYNEFLGTKGKAKEFEKPENRLETKEELTEKDPLYDMEEEEFEAMVKDSGFETKDQKAILKAKDKVKKFREIEAHYE